MSHNVDLVQKAGYKIDFQKVDYIESMLMYVFYAEKCFYETNHFNARQNKPPNRVKSISIFSGGGMLSSHEASKLRVRNSQNVQN